MLAGRRATASARAAEITRADRSPSTTPVVPRTIGNPALAQERLDFAFSCVSSPANGLQDLLHLSRNHYDRVIHFTFGFLLLYPMSELLIRSAHVREKWAPWLAATALCALSSSFEIVEAIIAQIVRPDLGAAYLGTQGDIWDAQKDMAAAFIGALLVAIWLTINGRSRR